MKYTLIALSLFAFACNGNKTTPSAAQPTEEVKPAPLPEPVVDKGPEAYFKGLGNGWALDLKSSMNGTFPLVLIQNSGKDTLKVVMNRVMEGNGKPASGKSSVNFEGVIEGTDKGEAITMSIMPGACTDNAGGKHNFSCKLSIGKKSLSGCGEYSEN